MPLTVHTDDSATKMATFKTADVAPDASADLRTDHKFLMMVSVNMFDPHSR